MSRTIEADVCIVGAGIAGLFAACRLPEGTRIAVIDKGPVGVGSSPLAQGGMAAAVGPGDSWDLHLQDTIAAGDRLVELRAAEVVCREAPARVEDLISLGCSFDTNPDGSLHLAREGGQTEARSVHRADETGAEMVRALRLAAGPRVERVEGTVLRFALADGDCAGVWTLVGGEVTLVRAPHTLLATGGAGALFDSTTNNPASTGDGIALGAFAGARLADLEFVQFHPTALAVEESPRPLLTEALRGAGAVLVDRNGRRFMPEAHPLAELAPRHVVTAAILASGGAFLDATSLGSDLLDREFPTVVSSCRARGFDPATQALPVKPAAHYLIGGVSTDLDGRTSIPHLYAAGECAATGMHGANRMAGNSLSESVVFAARAAQAMIDDEKPRAGDPDWTDVPRTAGDVATRRAETVAAVSLGAGPIRDAKNAQLALEKLETLAGEVAGSPADEAMVTTGDLLVRAALSREETRGVHARSDYPQVNPELDGVHFTR
ncbi:MAG: FAD-dependent oxidoreductase [Actinomycetota bacterium]